MFCDIPPYNLFVLDEEKNPVLVPHDDYRTWSAFFEDLENATVACDTIGGFEIFTYFLGAGSKDGNGLFKTELILRDGFSDPLTVEVRVHDSWQEATGYHMDFVERYQVTDQD